MRNKLIILTIAILAVIILIFLFSGNNIPKLKPLPAGATILAFGDSLTFGVGAEQNQSYPALLAQKTGLTIINSGVPGELSKDGLTRLDAELAKHHPTLVLLCHGGNDFLQKKDLDLTRQNIESMIKKIKSEGVEIVLIGTPKASITLNPPTFYRELATQYNIPYEGDILGRIIANRSLKSDQVHPNAKGYQLICDSVYQLMQKANLVQ